MAKDIFHDLVRSGLEQEGWIITDDPYQIDLDKTNFQIDLAAEKIIAAENQNFSAECRVKIIK